MTVSLGSLVDFQNGFTFKSKEYANAQVAGCEVLRMGYISRGGGFKEDDQPVFAPQDSKGNQEKYRLQIGDLVMAMTDMKNNVAILGCVAFIKDGGRFLLNQRVGRLRVKDELDTNPRFLYYLLNSPEVLEDVRSRANSGVQVNLTTTGILETKLNLPERGIQDSVAHILGTLDDKIELNQKMNQTLEDIAKAIFKSWFVDFDPVRAKAEGRPTGLPPEISDLFPDELVDSEIGEIPKGWDVTPLDEIGNFRNGLALQKYPAKDGEERLPVVKIAQLRKGSTHGDDLYASGVPSDFVITDGDYVFSWSGSLMAKYWVGGKGALNQHLFKVEEKTQPLWFIAGWVEHFMPEFQSIAESKATTMGHIKREHLKQAVCAIPSQELIKRSAEVMTPLIERSILSQQESKVISELRDTLLPKLISGELRIPDAEKFLEEAGI
jgi:type I restriction enzyme S subunit